MHVQEALRILVEIGMPRAQQNERSALCLLALCDLKKEDDWGDASAALIGVTPIMEFARKHYRKKYAPNTRETVRRQTLHQFVAAGIAAYNPDKPDRPVNSPDAVYRLTPEMLRLVRTFGRRDWSKALRDFVALRPALASQYAKPRSMRMVQLLTAPGESIALSPGAHSELIKQIVEVFGPRFAPGGRLLYAGDTGAKWGYHDAPALSALGVSVDSHGKMPDAARREGDRIRTASKFFQLTRKYYEYGTVHGGGMRRMHGTWVAQLLRPGAGHRVTRVQPCSPTTNACNIPCTSPSATPVSPT